jgi:serine/threonine-protein kinase
LTGASPFRGDTIPDSIGAILHKDLDWSLLPPTTPATVRHLLRRCLSKRRDMRMQDAGDARIELQLAIDDPTAAAEWAAPPTTSTARSRAGWLALGAAVVVAVLAGLFIGRNLRPTPAPLIVREFEIPVDGLEAGFGAPCLSPDGSRLIFRKDDRLWVRRLDEVEPCELPGTESARALTWSPDGQSIAFYADNRLWRYTIDGGSRSRICDLADNWVPGAGLSWGPDDRIVFATGNTDLFEVSAQGGDPKLLLERGDDVSEHFHWAMFLPEGKGLVYALHGMQGLDTFELLRDGERRTILQVPNVRIDDPVWSPSGHILYARTQDNEGIWALPFSLERLEATGDPFLVVPGGSSPSVSQDGSLLYVLGSAEDKRQILWVNEAGESVERVGEPQQRLNDPDVSPDGRRIALSAAEGNNIDIWLLDVDRGSRSRLTFDERPELGPIWMPDGKRILFTWWDPSGVPFTRSVSADGGTPEDVTQGEARSLSRDGRWLVVWRRNDSDGTRDLWAVDLESGAEATAVATTAAREDEAAISPDGRFLAYRTNESGRDEIQLRRFPSGDGRWQVSTDGGEWPVWSARGDRLFYLSGETIMAVSVQLEPTVALGRPEPLFVLGDEIVYFEGYDASRQLFLTVARAHETKSVATHPLRLMENWAAKLQPSDSGR